jgi:hypothetical protein
VCYDEAMIAAVGKYVDMIRLLDLEQEINTAKDARKQSLLVREAVAVSVRSGILSPYTSFVGVIRREAVVRKRPRIIVWSGFNRGYNCVELDVVDPNPQQFIVNALSAKFGVPADWVMIEFPGTEFHDCQFLKCKVLGENEMTIVILDTEGRPHQIPVDRTTTIDELKVRIHEKIRANPCQQMLSCRGMYLVRGTLADYDVGNNDIIHLTLGIAGGGDNIIISELEHVEKANDVSDLLEDHSVEGYWFDPAKMMAKSGLIEPPKLPHVDDALSGKILATVLALSILRKRYIDQFDLWQLLEIKALKWLSSVTRGVEINWTEIINSIVAKLTLTAPT